MTLVAEYLLDNGNVCKVWLGCYWAAQDSNLLVENGIGLRVRCGYGRLVVQHTIVQYITVGRFRSLTRAPSFGRFRSLTRAPSFRSLTRGTVSTHRASLQYSSPPAHLDSPPANPAHPTTEQ